MDTITKEVGNRRFPQGREIQESVSGKAVVQRYIWVFGHPKRRPLKRGERGKIGGEGFKKCWGEGFLYGAPCLGGTPREREVGMEEGEVGNQEMLNLSRIKTGGELEGWYVRTPTVWNSGGRGEKVMQGVLTCRLWTWNCSWEVTTQVRKCENLWEHLYKMLHNWATKI